MSDNSKANRLVEKPVDVLRSIGPKRSSALNKIGIFTIEDLFYYFPRRYLDRSSLLPISKLRDGMEVTVVGKIVNMGVKRGRRNRFMAILSDDSGGLLTCIWFSQFAYWQKIFKIGEWLAVSGKIKRFGGYQMTHPEFDRLGEDAEGKQVNTGKIIPLYPSSDSLTKVNLDSRGFRRLLQELVYQYKSNLPEVIPEHIRKNQHLMNINDAIENIHFPKSFEHLQHAQRRFKFDELFFMELLVAFRKKKFSPETGGISFEHVGEKTEKLYNNLPFDLTNAQKRVLKEIRSDMKSSRPMNRLLQGDVGSGKTIVALVTMLIAVENGYQTALMAPTEILAEQHFLTIHSMLEELGVRVLLLVGAQAKRERSKILELIANGETDIVIGTHALIQEHVQFHNLGLVVIDEQHRFGVLQRAELRGKGVNPDVLVMTATPIPRTLSMTVYGDLDVSILNELPKGRKPIMTHWRKENRRSKVYQYIRDEIKKGAQAYIVFPLVEESEKLDLKAATDSYEKMKDGFFKDFKMGLLHGRMKSDEKEAVMKLFKSGELDILVSTTVIEVGVDVPNATIMVIEHAERFGLSQLHQLRGRVGRGVKQSICILITTENPSGESKKRMQTMTDTNDGFKIAEVDLELRGPGEFFGTKQHGLPEMKIANIVQDWKLLQAAREEAFELVNDDPQLLKAEEIGTRHYFIKNYRDKYDLAWVG